MKQDKIKEIYETRLFLQKPSLKKDNAQLKYILEYLSKNKNINILDAGCGNGNYAFYLASLGYSNIFAVDLFSDIETKEFEYSQASIDLLPFEGGKFDFIYSNSVIFYLENPQDGIVEFNRVLKNDGLLMITAHTKYSLFTLWRVIKRDLFKMKSMEHLRGIKFHSATYYRGLLEQSGFEIVLQDGYEASYIMYPIYEKIMKGCKKYFNINLPTINPYIHTGIIGKLKSEFAYHSVLVAKKNSSI